MAFSDVPEAGPFHIAEALDQFRRTHPDATAEFDALAQQLKRLEQQVDLLRRVLMIPSDQWG